jgi:ornithine carrier protein
LGALVTCGAAGGAVTSLLLTPIELIKCQMQVPLSATSSRRPSPVSLVASVYRHHGILGFWHGQLGTLIRETGGSAAWFGSYEATSAIFRHYPSSAIMSEDRTALNPLPVWQQMASGATAGVAYNLIFYPADTIKSRMQTAEVGPILPGKQKAFWTVGRSVWQQQGIQGLYRGCGITVARAAPSSAFIFTIYEGLRGWLG